MNKKTFIITLLAALVIFGLSSCLSNKGHNNTRNARNNLNWEGAYSGSYMTNSGDTLNVRIILSGYQTLEFYCEYADNVYDPINFTIPLKWDDTGNIVMIDVMDTSVQYEVAKNKLTRLDTYKYTLKKER